MKRFCNITFLILTLLVTHSFEANATSVDLDSLKTVLAGKVSEIKMLNDHISSPAAQIDFGNLKSDMDLIYKQHCAEINENPEIRSLYDEYTTLRQQLERQLNDILLKKKKDSISGILQEKIAIFDSLYKVGQRLASEKKGDSVSSLKDKEKSIWMKIQFISDNNSDLIQSNAELQAQMDSLTFLDEQITSLSAKKPVLSR